MSGRRHGVFGGVGGAVVAVAVVVAWVCGAVVVVVVVPVWVGWGVGEGQMHTCAAASCWRLIPTHLVTRRATRFAVALLPGAGGALPLYSFPSRFTPSQALSAPPSPSSTALTPSTNHHPHPHLLTPTAGHGGVCGGAAAGGGGRERAAARGQLHAGRAPRVYRRHLHAPRARGEGAESVSDGVKCVPMMCRSCSRGPQSTSTRSRARGGGPSK